MPGPGRLETVLWFFFQAMADDLFAGGRDALPRQSHFRRFLFKNRRHGVYLGLAGEGAFARQHLIQDCAKTEDVTAVIHRFTAKLLGRHVGYCAQDRARPGLGRHGSEGPLFHDFRHGELRDAEIENLHPAVSGDEQVFRLQITMHDSLLVRGYQALCDLNTVVGHLTQRERPLEKPLS